MGRNLSETNARDRMGSCSSQKLHPFPLEMPWSFAAFEKVEILISRQTSSRDSPRSPMFNNQTTKIVGD